MTDQTASIAVIGGSGLYDMPGIEQVTTVETTTPYGDPSGDITIGTLSGKRVAFLARHGAGHIYTPTTVPYCANIYALKTLGVRHIIAISACGSLYEDYAPGHLVVPDQLYDNTKHRHRTFFDTGLVAHVGVADPFCAELSDIVFEALRQTDATVHRGGTFITIEGPRFSTRGESNIFRQWGCKLIGMTTSPEAYLAREAEIAYTVIAHVTDYDVWHESEEAVTVEVVMRTVAQNVDYAKQAVALAVQNIDVDAEWDCHNALANAIMTAKHALSDEQRQRLAPIVGRYYAD